MLNTFANLPVMSRVACILTLCALTLGAQPAWGQVSSFEIGMSSSEAVLASDNDPTILHLESWDSPLVRAVERNMPFIELTNTSTNMAPITEFRMTIGDELFNFSDTFLGEFALVGNTTADVLITASTAMNGDELVIQFGNGGLAANDTVRFRVDIDRDDPLSGYLYPDYRTVFFDLFGENEVGDSSDNSTVTVSFDVNGTDTPIVQTLLDQPRGPNTFVNSIRPYSTMEDVEFFGGGLITPEEVIPEPTAIGLLGIGLAVFAARRHRR